MFIPLLIKLEIVSVGKISSIDRNDEQLSVSCDESLL